ncbi:hypothetical protein GP486_006742 [Trichoglossum hirsutum]|uniref:Clr5 domain-containing protein n=1 Tax=Trichoglossum hirsutum TaxID=265104 RepID=A0A9P8IGI1_9PEZI|nr:hypothetical protein GP486_006742 [Trichoglossum hirsutum]
MSAAQAALSRSSLLNVPFPERWERLRPLITQLYIDDNRKLLDIVQTLKDEYGFDATEVQYKYQITKKWKLRKSLTASKKSAICATLRGRASRPTAVEHKGRNVDAKLRRHLKAAKRQDIALRGLVGGNAPTASVPALSSSNSIFLYWNMPYGAMKRSKSGVMDHLSPLGAASTPSDILVTTPPVNANSPQTHTSSLLAADLRMKKAVDRAHLFVAGRHDDFIRSMDQGERRSMSTWLYQFWFYSFKSAKYWGRGPREWTADLLGFDNFNEVVSSPLPGTPASQFNTVSYHNSPSDVIMTSPGTENPSNNPTPLCRWSIHVRNIPYTRVASPPRPQDEVEDINDPESWRAWPEAWMQPEFQERLRNNLASNDFSNIDTIALPVAVNQVARAAEKSPKVLLVEAIGFSIIGHNRDLLSGLLGEAKETNVEIDELYPFHLATSYLDGSSTCCDVLGELVLHGSFGPTPRKLYQNNLGHTVLDNLMIVILKSHSSILPGAVDDAWKNEKRFPGAEVDICGRWDADSGCVRKLLANGNIAIPFHWKHKFCHTSVQAICHCIRSLFATDWSPDINTPSGLFIKRCGQCGLKLQLLPLHTLVLTAAHLALYGCEDEELFGMVACLLCLIANGADPSLKAHISALALLGKEMGDECSHEALTPAELAERMKTKSFSRWPQKAKIGWELFCYILQTSQQEREQNSNYEESYEEELDSYDEDINMDTDDNSPYRCYNDEHHDHFFGKNKDLAILWAAVQTEFLTYRRINEEDTWISANFNMHTLLEGLKAGFGVSIGLVEKQLMKPFCRCGRFNREVWGHERVDEVSAQYFSNLDLWERATYLPDYFGEMLAEMMW